jgi:hypothetical protein
MYHGENITFVETAEQNFETRCFFEAATRTRRDAIVSDSVPILPFDNFHWLKTDLLYENNFNVQTLSRDSRSNNLEIITWEITKSRLKVA